MLVFRHKNDVISRLNAMWNDAGFAVVVVVVVVVVVMSRNPTMLPVL